MKILQTYFIEIKNSVLLIGLSWSLSMLLCYSYKETLLFLIMEPSMNLNDPTKVHFIFTTIVEIFSMYWKIIFWMSNHFLAWYFLYHWLLFMSFGLYKIEYVYISYFMTTSIAIWMMSLYFFNKLLFPFTWIFFSSYGEFYLIKSMNFYFESKIGDYMKFFMQYYYMSTLYFQFSIIFFMIFNHLKNNLIWLNHVSKKLYCGLMLFITLMTPPDVFSQVFLSLSLISLYEVLFLATILKLNIQKMLEY